MCWWFDDEQLLNQSDFSFITHKIDHNNILQSVKKMKGNEGMINKLGTIFETQQ